MEYRDRHVIVTGGTGALGTAVVGALLEEGATCHVPYIADAEAERFAFRGHDRVTLHAGADLSEEAAVLRIYGSVPRLWASIHLAGGFAMAAATETTKAALTKQLEMNLVSCFLCCREAVRAMKVNGGGRIVNVAARAGLEPRLGAGMTAYTISKAGVAALTQALAQEVAAESIWVNAVAPSIMDTPVNRRDMPEADHQAWPKVAEVAATVLFLASPANEVTRGAVVPVYGKA